MEDTQNKINNMNSLFSNMIDNYKKNYVNYHKNTTLSMPTTTSTKTENVVSGSNSNVKDSNIKDSNEEPLSNYRYAANNLLEHVRSQMASNSRTISKINSDIVPVQTQYLSVLGSGDIFENTTDYFCDIEKKYMYNKKSAPCAALDDYNELYKVTFFSILMYLIGSASILYLMFKPKLQSV